MRNKHVQQDEVRVAGTGHCQSTECLSPTSQRRFACCKHQVVSKQACVIDIQHCVFALAAEVELGVLHVVRVLPQHKITELSTEAPDEANIQSAARARGVCCATTIARELELRRPARPA